MKLDDLRNAIIKELNYNRGRLELDEFVEEYEQPREPVKRVLDELCDYDKLTKTYKMKNKLI